MPQRGVGLATRPPMPSLEFFGRYHNAGNSVNASPHDVMVPGALTSNLGHEAMMIPFEK
nr:hypothetical protein [Tanacetum cinerariifolium]